VALVEAGAISDILNCEETVGTWTVEAALGRLEFESLCALTVNVEGEVAFLVTWVVVEEDETIWAKLRRCLSSKTFPVLVALHGIWVESVTLSALEPAPGGGWPVPVTVEPQRLQRRGLM